jgi:hypothetical protein
MSLDLPAFRSHLRRGDPNLRHRHCTRAQAELNKDAPFNKNGIRGTCVSISKYFIKFSLELREENEVIFK